MKKLIIGILMILALAFSVSAHPVLYPVSDQEINESDTLSFEISTITVPDLGDSTFDFSPSLDWISVTRINNTAATVTLSPDYDNSGVYDVEFSVSDDNSTHTDNAIITVNNVNRAPSLDLPASETLIQGFPETLNLDSYASDPDGDSLSYQVLADNDAEVNCERSGSTLTMTAATNFTGTASCTIEASDGDLTDSDTISITVQAQNPSVSIGEVDFGNVDLNETTSTKSFNIKNNGNMNLNNILVTWDSDYDKYNITFTNDVTSTLNVGVTDSASVHIYIPGDQSTGTLTIPLKFTSDELNTTFDLKANVRGRLRITDLDVKVDDKTDSNLQDKEDDYKIGEKAKPESHVTFSVRVENAFPDDGPEIEDIVVTITIEEIDEDEDDLEEESEEFNLDPDDTKKVDLEFDIPLKVNEEDYSVIIEVEGEDEDGTSHRIVKTLLLEVNKETHDLMIKKVLLSPEMVQCTRTADLDVTVINIGSREEEEVVINVKSTALGIDITERDIELSEDPDDDDNEFEKTFELEIGDDVKAGTYSIEVRTYYDEDKLEDLERVNLQVQDCKPVTPPVEEEEEEVEVITPPEEEEEEEITPPAAEEKEPFTQTTEYVLLLVLVNVIVIIVVIALLIALLRK